VADGGHAGSKEKRWNEFQELDQKLQNTFPKFHYKPCVLEEMTTVTQNIHDKLQGSWTLLTRLEAGRKSKEEQNLIAGEQHKIQALEAFVRLPRKSFSRPKALEPVRCRVR